MRLLSGIVCIGSVGCLNLLAANHPQCAEEGRRLMLEGGDAVSVFIAVMLCEGVVNPQDTGLGGGFMAVLYDRTCGAEFYYDARERSAIRDIVKFKNKTHNIGMPGMMRGIVTMWNHTVCGYNRAVKWKRIWDGSIALAQQGHVVTSRTYEAYKERNLLSWLSQESEQRFTRRNVALAEQMDLWSNLSPDDALHSFYSTVLDDMRRLGRPFDEQDIPPARIDRPTSCKVGAYRYLTTRRPGSGMVLCVIIALTHRVLLLAGPLSYEKQLELCIIMQYYLYALLPHTFSIKKRQLNQEMDDVAFETLTSLMANHTIAPQLPSRFGNIRLPTTNFQQHGTSNVVVRIRNVTIVGTHSINAVFGSHMYSNQLGLFYNNQLADFGQHPHNRRTPNTAPQSCMSGLIAIDVRDNTTVFAAGAAGGSKIPATIFLGWFAKMVIKDNLNAALSRSRCLVRIAKATNIPSVECEHLLDAEILQRRFSHTKIADDVKGFAAMTAIDQATSMYDVRRGGGWVITDEETKTNCFQHNK